MIRSKYFSKQILLFSGAQLKDRGCFPKFANGLNIKIGIVQKVYEWPSCPFVKMIPWLENHFGKRTAWSLLYFLNYAYFNMYPIHTFWETPSRLATFFDHLKIENIDIGLKLHEPIWHYSVRLCSMAGARGPHTQLA